MDTKDTQNNTTTTAGLPAQAGKKLVGTVIKSAMQDTATVRVQRYVRHPKYMKFIKRFKTYLVHDPGNTAAVGEKVTIRETRPMSKRKTFVIEK